MSVIEQKELIKRASDLLHRAWRLVPPGLDDPDDLPYRWYRDVEQWWRDSGIEI